ncbi:ubiquitin-like protein [Linderina pennispora]|uniref:Ubiquitin-like protein n=1 Tax=Linderina pennispora TaxID=61395 RepID=A0A1Y1WEZ0_9FUNG|nr:ubiquitin-like protein [Linderina pennispora]ORX72063.1 ubiquitin-like protein [Linderina pennispora]
MSGAPVGTDIHLTLLMVSSARVSLTFKPEDTVLSVKETLLRSWPKDFDAKPAGPGNLRIVYLGHFLEDGDTLAESKLQPGNTTVHLTIKASAAPEKTAKKDIDKAPKCTCTIL